jgi:hypothetical protein
MFQLFTIAVSSECFKHGTLTHHSQMKVVCHSLFKSFDHLECLFERIFLQFAQLTDRDIDDFA